VRGEACHGAVHGRLVLVICAILTQIAKFLRLCDIVRHRTTSCGTMDVLPIKSIAGRSTQFICTWIQALHSSSRSQERSPRKRRALRQQAQAPFEEADRTSVKREDIQLNVLGHDCSEQRKRKPSKLRRARKGTREELTRALHVWRKDLCLQIRTPAGALHKNRQTSAIRQFLFTK
jgi:hypothetical protein